ncbi:MAG TPA: hypothetical protein VFR08_00555 [Candidatus Angelobacter sp.]|nr:hypothetical protein [Candidatus Angelobacter sp.]
MNRCSTVFVLILFVAGLCWATILPAKQIPVNQATLGSKDQPASPGAARQTPSDNVAILSRGTTLVGEFSHGLNARKLKAGDKVKAILTQDLIVKGKIIAPNETRLVGHVTEVKRSTGADMESRLGIVFDKLLLKHHHELLFQAGVEALLAPVIRRSRVDEPDQMMPPAVVGSVNNSNTVGRGSSGSSRSSSSGASTSAVASLNSIGAIPVVQSTPGSSSPGSSVSAIDLSQISPKRLNASTGMRGVYGIKDLSISPDPNPTGAGSVIISKKSNVKLENGTQLILVVLR